ncbi:MAG: response regulator, partial [Planctomycetes bacterium]|nr:response regulator [Planctomycetota bacterium]
MANRILVVDDTVDNIQAISSILRGKGYQVAVAMDGQKALAAIEKSPPDLILLDVMMPVMDGHETCRRLKASLAWREIPVIFLTGKNATEDIVRGFELGAVDYVGKPFNAHELLARVHTHLQIDRLNRENTRLLLNILPSPIAERLKKTREIIADRYDDVSILFADIVGFTPLSAKMQPTGLVELLNRLFSLFDDLGDRFHLEKIKTIGDAYMIAGGLPAPREGHLEDLASMALAMQDTLDQRQAELPGLTLRIGIHVGSVVAGVIGSRKFSYDVWGDTVNTASRMESHGAPGRVHVSEAVYLRLKDRFRFEARGEIFVKGQGEMSTYFLLSE